MKKDGFFCRKGVTTTVGGYAGGSVELDETVEDEVSNVDIVYICRNYTGTLGKQENEVEELKFFALNEIPKKISPPIQKPLNQWIELQKRSSNKIISNDLTGGSKWE